MPQMRTSALLFDMDGTLVDSTAFVESTWTSFSQRHCRDIGEVLVYVHGRPTEDTVHHFLADVDEAIAETRQIIDYEESEITGIAEVPGAASLLGSLPPNCWAVVTSASRKLAEARLGAAGLPVPRAVVCAGDVKKAKLDPKGYLRAAALLGIGPTDAIVFEDSLAGVRAGIDTAARTIVIGAMDHYDGQVERYIDFRDIHFRQEDST